MDIKKILIISLIVVALMASVSAGLFDGLFGGEPQDNVIEIDHITFNTTNATKFELYNESEVEGTYCKWYMDENKTGYNVHIYNFSGTFNNYEDFSWSDALEICKGDMYDNIPSQTINGIVVYTTTANVGDKVGEPRYVSFVENRDAKTFVDLWSPDPNETAKMALSLKFK